MVDTTRETAGNSSHAAVMQGIEGLAMSQLRYVRYDQQYEVKCDCGAEGSEGEMESDLWCRS